MEKIVIIGANDFQNSLILKAKELGYETHVFAWQDGKKKKKTADVFYPISIVEKERIYEECVKIKPVAVVSIASDLASITVNYVARKLNLPCNDEACVRVTTNKYEMRKCLKENGISVPKFYKHFENEKIDYENKISLPVIVKPTDRSGSRGITKITRYEDIEKAVERSVKDSFEKCAIVEEYIEGDEYSCEAISYNGKHRILAVTKKYTTGSPNFIETGHIEPAGLPYEKQAQIEETIKKALDALGVKNGASHSEFKVDAAGNVKIIEIGARMGGDCIGSNLVQLSTGYDFVKMVIDVGLGKEPDFTHVCNPSNAAIKFIFNQEDYNEINEFIEKHLETLVYESGIKKNESVVDSSTRWGFVIFASDNRELLEKIFCQNGGWRSIGKENH